MAKLEPDSKPEPEKYFNEIGNDKVYIYCRVSKASQDINKQFEQCLRYAKDKKILPPLKNVFFDNGVSGGKSWKEREINKLTFLKKGNILIVPELSRIGRDFMNTCHFLDIVLPNGCLIHEIKGDFVLHQEMEMNDRLKTMFSCMCSEIERDNIKKRTKSAMQSEKVKAKIPNKLDLYKNDIINWKNDGKNANEITNLLKEKGLNINKSQTYIYFKKLP